MKKFYEAPVVEFTGFSAEDVITTSTVVTEINPTGLGDFETVVGANYTNKAMVDYSGTSGSYQW